MEMLNRCCKNSARLKSLILSGVMVVLAAPGSAFSAEFDQLKNQLNSTLPDKLKVSKVIDSPMDGVYQVEVRGKPMYVKSNEDHVLIGEEFDRARKVSLGEEIQLDRAKQAMASLDENEMIVYGDDDASHTITVFTDVDCAYCRKLHTTVPALTDAGVKVRYIWYPRAGLKSASYNKAVSVYCADDQQSAMDDAKLKRQFVNGRSCDNPIAKQYQTGRRVGLRGTPTIYFDDGTKIGGYRPADKMLARLGMTGPTKVAAAQ